MSLRRQIIDVATWWLDRTHKGRAASLVSKETLANLFLSEFSNACFAASRIGTEYR